MKLGMVPEVLGYLRRSKVSAAVGNALTVVELAAPGLTMMTDNRLVVEVAPAPVGRGLRFYLFDLKDH